MINKSDLNYHKDYFFPNCYISFKQGKHTQKNYPCDELQGQWMAENECDKVIEFYAIDEGQKVNLMETLKQLNK